MKKILSFCAALLFAFAANAAVINITNETSDALRIALGTANDGDEIVMAAGTYVESNGNYIAFDDKAVTVKAAEGATVIIQPQVPITVSNGGHAIFENVKIDASRLTELADWYEHLLYVTDGTPNGCTFRGCELYGFNLNKSMFYCNTDNKVAAMKFENCYFHDLMKSIVFIENAEGKPMVSVKNCTFENISTNTESYYAGIIDIRATEATLQVDHCTFYNVIPMNTDYSCVSKITLAKGTVSNCIFMLPTAQDGIRAMRGVAATNCITFNYLKDGGTGIHSSVTQTNCIQVDPAFVDPDNGNFTLGEGSPALTMNDGQPIGDPRWLPAAALEAPDAAPAAPQWPANQVKAVYSATYNADCGFGEWGSGTAYEQGDFGKKYVTTNLGYFGLTFEDNALNCTSMEKLHIDIWIAADASVRVVPIWDASANIGVTLNLEGQKWNSFDIALSEFDGVPDWSNIYQIKIDNAANLIFWVNNVFFYTTVAPAVDEVAPTDFTAVADEASFFSAKIKAKATDNSGAVEFNVINGELIVATVKAASEAETIITVKNLAPNTVYNFSVVAKDESGNATEPIAVATKTLEAPAAAPAPVIDAAKVKSIYSDAYEFAPASLNSYNEDWWSKPDMLEGELAEGDKALFYAKVAEGMIGWQFGEIDVTDFPFLHIDIYPLADGSIMIYPVDNIEPKQEYKETYEVKGGKWNNLVIDMSGKDLTKIFQIGWINYVALNGFFIDNVFYSSENTVPEVGTAIDNTAAAVKAQKVIMNGQLFIIREGEIFNAQGQIVR